MPTSDPAPMTITPFYVAGEWRTGRGSCQVASPSDRPLAAGAGTSGGFPCGAVLGISPFTCPVALVAHKMAPALAVGATSVLKPAGATPRGALALAEVFDATERPKGVLSGLRICAGRAYRLVE